ncbi:Mitotic spindle assembly checkpoint protein MAD2B [Trametes pubescens]|uniref:Mitotic spindle assembly checkpoint protein MAD2B n=1 Tax=Trametes pubescens TaxID=154538 RepID=A0A1M2W7U6_TRAPU|nr:Mitotic spindle assembly checkpoint protein MAD2B [Trametes pubescens]
MTEAVRGVAEFIEVAVHTILYVRHVYPADLFVRRRKYDTPVYQSRHPALNEYIAGAVKAVTEELTLGTVDKVVLVIKSADEKPLERFIFALRSTLQDPPPWVPAARPETTAGAADAAELHMVRAVDTGIIDVRVIATGQWIENSLSL